MPFSWVRAFLPEDNFNVLEVVAMLRGSLRDVKG